MSRSSETGRERNYSNFISGWLLAAALYTGAWILDPLAVWHAPDADTGQVDRFYLTVVGCLAGGSLLGYLFFARPYVSYDQQHVLVRNPLTIWTLPKDSLSDLNEKGMHVAFVSGKRKVRAFGLEQSNLDTWSGRRRAAAKGSKAIEGRRAPSAPQGSAQRRWALWDWPFGLLVLGWWLYLGLALTRFAFTPW